MYLPIVYISRYVNYFYSLIISFFLSFIHMTITGSCYERHTGEIREDKIYICFESSLIIISAMTCISLVSCINSISSLNLLYLLFFFSSTNDSLL